MASSASDAGHSEKEICEKLVKTGSVAVMMAFERNTHRVRRIERRSDFTCKRYFREL